MNINELNKIKTINVGKVIDETVVGSGTFKELLDNVYNETIIPLVDSEGEIVGINYDTKKESLIDDNMEELRFQLKYLDKNIIYWIQKCLELKAKEKEEPEVEETKDYIKVTLKSNNQSIYIEGYRNNDYEVKESNELDKYYDSLDIRLYTNEKVLHYYLNFISDSIYGSDLYMALDGLDEKLLDINYLAEMLDAEVVDDEDDLEGLTMELSFDLRHPEPYTKKELPEVVEITIEQLGCPMTDSSIKKYLRKKYGHYLQKDNELDIAVYANDIIVRNIKWGRKIS